MGSPVKVGGVRVTECSSESGIWIGGFRNGQSGPGLAFGLAQSDAPETNPDLVRSGRSVGGTSGVAVRARWLCRGRRVFALSGFKDDMVRCEVQRARRRSGEWGALGERRPVAPRELHGPYLRAQSISLQLSQLLSSPLRCALMRSPSSQPRPGDDGREIRTGRASYGPPFEGSARLTVLVLIASISCQSRPPREKEGRIVYSASSRKSGHRATFSMYSKFGVTRLELSSHHFRALVPQACTARRPKLPRSGTLQQ